MKKTAPTFLAGLTLLFASSHASAEDVIFKSYVHDSPITSYTATQGYYDCSEDIGAKALCLDGVKFIDQDFTAVLVFSAEKLISVSLVAGFDQALYAKAIGALTQSFTLVTLADSNSQLDLLDLANKSASRADYTTALANYESVGLNSGNLTYTFVEKNVTVKGYKSFVTALATAPDNARTAELMVASEGADNNVMIRFSLPKLEAKKIMSEVNKPVEKF